MKVTLRKRKRNGKTVLYLDYYEKGKRKAEFLKLSIIDNPKNTEQRKSNKDILLLAETIRSKRQLEIYNNEYSFKNTEKAGVRFLIYFELHTEKRKESNGNYGNWKSTFKHLKAWKDGDVRISQIDSKWLEAFKLYLKNDVKTKTGKNLSGNSCLSYFNKVKAVLKQAKLDRIITNNPADLVKGFQPEEFEREFLTLEELKRAITAPCGNPVTKNSFLFSCMTGLRFSDLQKLTWSEIQQSEENGYYIRFKQKKTKGIETLPFSDDALQFLGERKSGDKKVFTDLVYSESNNHVIRLWISKAKIEKHITYHSARHTYATLQLTLGTDIYTVSKLLGHKYLKTTEIYAKIIDSKKKEAANRIKL